MTHVDHLDGNPRNNDPDNLRVVADEDDTDEFYGDAFFGDAEHIADLLEAHGGVTVTVDAGNGRVYSATTVGESIFEDGPALAGFMRSMLQRAKAANPDVPRPSASPS